MKIKRGSPNFCLRLENRFSEIDSLRWFSESPHQTGKVPDFLDKSSFIARAWNRVSKAHTGPLHIFTLITRKSRIS